LSRERTRRRFFWVVNNTLNRVTIPLARSGHGPISLIRHVGRKSGRTYETPVILAKVADGFVAELTYGENVNWYRNCVAAGGCVVISHGREYAVTRIEPCSTERGLDAYPEPFRLILKAGRRKEFRVLLTDTAESGV
jgi:deazaflavin-dependent oxidoreductase (nitroreductase family)